MLAVEYLFDFGFFHRKNVRPKSQTLHSRQNPEGVCQSPLLTK